MGLDWCVRDKPRPGFEERVIELREEVESLSVIPEEKRDEKRLRDLAKELDAATICPGETINAPRVGIDEAATRWFLEEVYQPRREGIKTTDSALAREYWSREFEDVLEDEKGKYVIQLSSYDKSTCTGIAANGVSFRGKMVGYCETWIEEGLRNEAYEDHEAAETLDYGKRLQAEICERVRNRNIEFSTLGNDFIFKRFLDTRASLRKQVEEKMPSTPEFTSDPEFWSRRQVLAESLIHRLPGPDRILQADETLGSAIDASEWLVFWGARGHGFHAWY